MDYSNHSEVLAALKKDQNAEKDLRDEIDDVIHFTSHPQGQWERWAWESSEGRPRYTFDQMESAISKTWAEMAANEYVATTQPVGDGADEAVSNIFDGLIRNIYDIGCFDDISTREGKRMIRCGYGAWRLRTKYIDQSFYQDIVPEPIPDSHRRVWFDCASELQTREDAMHVHVLSKISEDECKRRWKRDSFESLDDQKTSEAYQYKPEDMVTVGEIIYKERYKKDIHLVQAGDEFQVLDNEGLTRLGIQKEQIKDTRPAECFKVYTRKYDNKGWLDEKKLTAFDYLPVIPVYAFFDVSEGKVTYKGLVRDRMDAQRVFNYVESRKIEESVLAPRRKIFADNRAVSGYEHQFGKLHRDPRSVQAFNGEGADNIKHGHGAFFEIGGAMPNPALSELSQDMIRNMQLTSGQVNNLEEAQLTKRDSNFRAEQRDSVGQVGTFEYYRGLKVALEHTAKVLLRAIPKVYDTDRKIRVVDEAGQSSEERINYKDASGKVINNLTSGKYDITVKVGAGMQSRKAEANDGILRMAEYDPAVLSRNTDIIAKNIDAPGMNMVADRERAILFQQNLIPESQWTNEERQQKEQAAENQKPDPAAMIAQAELQKAQFQAVKAQAELELKQLELAGKQNREAVELMLKQQGQEYDNLLKASQAAKNLTDANQPVNPNPVNKAESQI